MAYHPNYFNETISHRQDCRKRLDLLSTYVEEGSTLLDLGCSGGYYSFGLSEKCSKILAIDSVKELIVECNNIKEANNISNVDFIEDDILRYLDFSQERWDYVLYLSTHHHVIGINGIPKASKFLKSLSERCNTMFFDMGQKNEKCPQHYWWKALPTLNVTQDTWLEQYLSENTVYNNREIIGTSPIHGVTRSLWKLDKV